VGGSDSATSQVTSTVDSAVQTTQQTASTTVTNVESTVQTTVQATTQAAAPQPAAAPAPQVSAPTASKQAVTRAAAPVTKQVAAVAQPRTQVTRVAAPTGPAKLATGASAKAVRVAAVKRSAGRGDRTASRSTAAGDGPAPVGCDVPQLSLLPGGSQLQALLSIACAAAGGLDLPARLGLVAPATAAHTSGDNPAGSAHSSTPSVLARTASQSVRHSAVGARRAAAASANAGGAGLPLATSHGAGRAGSKPLAFPNAYPTATVASAPGSQAQAAGSAGHHHHGFFSGQTGGTEILMAIIFANIVILAGIALWRLAARFVIPRLA
jgi:hypothetical protein